MFVGRNDVAIARLMTRIFLSQPGGVTDKEALTHHRASQILMILSCTTY